MARTDRLFRLLDTLRRLPQPVTAARLADETGVSERTLYRDIDTLRAGGALIDGAPGYGYTLTEDLALPPQTFTREEIEALLLGLAEVPHRGDRALALAAETALGKIIATLPDRQQRQAQHAAVMVRRAERPAAPLADLSLIRAAIWDETAVRISYVDATGTPSDRRILPLATVYVDRGVMILAWCVLRQDFRKFMADRIQGVSATDESFRPRRTALLRDYVAILTAR
ncbi:YafY family transcriptional regulator [Loktanella sp. TSTF-M6]|uniref:YafY family transcriptional regulator n=1 Tax=Loktanella gaetbuli TaxID=2881335 RepID=A0ABS8BUH9_9RHOB|nr:YafY family protein [Loktanella gaetbuli]MCB5199407.1 YafY family transcriptional regulator [Loktanella gaetbuli]